MHDTNRRHFIKTVAAAGFFFSLQTKCTLKSKPNVLFIAVDDLRPQLGCYGQKHVISPNIDKLAAEGFLAARAYCNVPVCGASRASLLTGMRPNRSRFLNFHTWAEKDIDNPLSLPLHFKQNGYYTLSNGKVFHHAPDCQNSWSEEPWRPKGKNWRDYITEENIALFNADNGKAKAFEIADVEDNDYFDGKIADKAIADLESLSDMQQPFFLAVGFLKPHLPFNAPKKYWDMYDREALPVAENNYPPQNAPKQATHNWGELRAYTEIPPQGPLDDEYARTLVHGYHACVSFTDAQIGRVISKLDKLGLRDNTIIILWGDHGWNLREHGLWCKHCNFNTSLQAPIIISAPHTRQGVRSNALVEFVDIYPTVCELAGIPTPEHCDGKSFVPLMQNPDQPWKNAVYSRFHSGESVRTDRYLYTEWHNKDGQMTANMLYDHENDPHENINIAAEQPSIVKQMAVLLHDMNNQIN